MTSRGIGRWKNSLDRAQRIETAARLAEADRLARVEFDLDPVVANNNPIQLGHLPAHHNHIYIWEPDPEIQMASACHTVAEGEGTSSVHSICTAITTTEHHPHMGTICLCTTHILNYT